MKIGLLATTFLALGIAEAHGSASVGSPAPALEPTEWLNTKTPTTWKDLKGRLILIEKWATW